MSASDRGRAGVFENQHRARTRLFALHPRPRVGLLGGSFNPAHAGHLHISREALRRLDLDELWWLVTPQNPLKPAHGMAPLAKRLAGARAVAAGAPRVRVMTLERVLGARYTCDLLDAVRRRWRRVGFVWLIGADNLAQLHRWRRWTRICNATPIAIFDRPAYSFSALASVAARRYRGSRRSPRAARRLARTKPPAWAFFANRRHAASATAERAWRARGSARPAP